MSDSGSFFEKLSSNLQKLNTEVDILVDSLRDKENSKKAMDNLVKSNQNEMRTKSPIYDDVDTAQHMTQEGNEVEDYVLNRVKQIFGGD